MYQHELDPRSRSLAMCPIIDLQSTTVLDLMVVK